MKEGNYKIVYGGPGPCKGRLLSYKKYGNAYPDKVTLGSPASTSPVLWQLDQVGNGEVILNAINRASCCPAKLSYASNTCTSKTAQLQKTGSMRFKLIGVDRLKSIYRLDAAVRSLFTYFILRCRLFLD